MQNGPSAFRINFLFVDLFLIFKLFVFFVSDDDMPADTSSFVLKTVVSRTSSL